MSLFQSCVQQTVYKEQVKHNPRDFYFHFRWCRSLLAVVVAGGFSLHSFLSKDLPFLQETLKTKWQARGCTLGMKKDQIRIVALIYSKKLKGNPRFVSLMAPKDYPPTIFL